MTSDERQILEMLVGNNGSLTYGKVYSSCTAGPLNFRKAVLKLTAAGVISLRPSDTSAAILPGTVMSITADGWKFLDGQ